MSSAYPLPGQSPHWLVKARQGVAPATSACRTGSQSCVLPLGGHSHAWPGQKNWTSHRLGEREPCRLLNNHQAYPGESPTVVTAVPPAPLSGSHRKAKARMKPPSNSSFTCLPPPKRHVCWPLSPGPMSTLPQRLTWPRPRRHPPTCGLWPLPNPGWNLEPRWEGQAKAMRWTLSRLSALPRTLWFLSLGRPGTWLDHGGWLLWPREAACEPSGG